MSSSGELTTEWIKKAMIVDVCTDLTHNDDGVFENLFQCIDAKIVLTLRVKFVF